MLLLLAGFVARGTVPAAYTLEERQKQFKALLRSAGDEDTDGDIDILAPYLEPVSKDAKGFLGWLDKTVEKL